MGHYCFVFVVSFGDTPLARSIQANVTVAPERLVPIVEGGSSRVWSDSQDLVLDGSKSYDPNLEDGDQTPLSFHWACVAATQVSHGGTRPPRPARGVCVMSPASLGSECPVKGGGWRVGPQLGVGGLAAAGQSSSGVSPPPPVMGCRARLAGVR